MLAWEASMEAIELRRRPDEDDEFEDDGFTFDDDDEDDLDDDDEDFDDEDADFEDDEDDDLEPIDVEGEDDEEPRPKRRGRNVEDI